MAAILFSELRKINSKNLRKAAERRGSITPTFQVHTVDPPSVKETKMKAFWRIRRIKTNNNGIHAFFFLEHSFNLK